MSNNQLQDYSIESSNLKAKRRPSENSNGYSNGGWRKYSGQSKGSFDNSYKGSNGGYPKKYKRERFNSEGNSKWGNNHYNFGFKSQVEEIEIDISKIKYSLEVNYKYPLDTVQVLYNKMKENKRFENKPTFIKIEEIVGDKPKEIVIFSKTSLPSTNSKPIAKVSLKLPSTNPLCNINKSYNKFDMVHSKDEIKGEIQKESLNSKEDTSK